jgi:hypothetical protein
MIRESIAWAERWNTYAVFGVGQTYKDSANRPRCVPTSEMVRQVRRPSPGGIFDRFIPNEQCLFKKHL